MQLTKIKHDAAHLEEGAASVHVLMPSMGKQRQALTSVYARSSCLSMWSDLVYLGCQDTNRNGIAQIEWQLHLTTAEQAQLLLLCSLFTTSGSFKLRKTTCSKISYPNGHSLCCTKDMEVLRQEQRQHARDGIKALRLLCTHEGVAARRLMG